MTRVAVVLSLVVALVAGSVATATAAPAPGGPSAEVAAKARAKRRAKKKAKKKAKAKRRAARRRSATGVRDGRYKWSLPGSSAKHDLVVSGNGTRVTLTYTFFRYGSSGGECAPTPVTFKGIRVRKGPSSGILVFRSNEVKVGPVEQDGANGGVASARGEFWLKQRSFNLNLSIRVRNHNDRTSCFEFPSGDGKLR